MEISPEQLNYVINSSAGTGLLKFGATVVPFDNTVEKDSELYKLYNTNIYEKMVENKLNTEV